MHTFTAGALARAEHVNENFTELLNKITTLEQTLNHINDGKLVINGTPYNLTGTVSSIPSFTFSNYNGVYAGSFNINNPYTPPAGWGFVWEMDASTGFTLVSTVGRTSSYTICRIVQIGSSDPRALQRLRYRLVKL